MTPRAVVLYFAACLFVSVSIVCAFPVKGCGSSGASTSKVDTTIQANSRIAKSSDGKLDTESDDNKHLLDGLKETVEALRVGHMAKIDQESFQKGVSSKNSGTESAEKPAETVKMFDSGVVPHVKVLAGHIGGDERKPQLLADHYSYLTTDERESISAYLESKGMDKLYTTQ